MTEYAFRVSTPDSRRKDGICKIVLTGGPCAGKSSALESVTKALEKAGYNVLVVPETATEIMVSGALVNTFPHVNVFQRFVYIKQLNEEALYEEIASGYDGKTVIVCDRGAVDGRAYMEDVDYYNMLAEFGHERDSILDLYDGVIHLRSAAIGAVEHYQWNGGEGDCNNPIRREPPEVAAKLDEETLRSWDGHRDLRVIDNSTDFQGKLDKIVSAALDIAKG